MLLLPQSQQWVNTMNLRLAVQKHFQINQSHLANSLADLLNENGQFVFQHCIHGQPTWKLRHAVNDYILTELQLDYNRTTLDNDLAFAQCVTCVNTEQKLLFGWSVWFVLLQPHTGYVALVANQTRSQQLHSSPQNVINWINQTNQSCDLGHVT